MDRSPGNYQCHGTEGRLSGFLPLGLFLVNHSHLIDDNLDFFVYSFVKLSDKGNVTKYLIHKSANDLQMESFKA